MNKKTLLFIFVFLIGLMSVNAYNYTFPVYYNINYSVYSQNFYFFPEPITQDLSFNNNGTIMFLLGDAGDKVYEFNLSIPYDINTSILNTNLSVVTYEPSPKGFDFNNNGTKIFIVGGKNIIYSFNLSIPYSVNSSIFDKSYNASWVSTATTDVKFNNNGTKFYLVSDAGNYIYEFNLSIPYDINTTMYNTFLDVDPLDRSPSGLRFNPSGSKMYLSGFEHDKVYEYNLGIAFNINSSVFSQDYYVGSQEASPFGVCFNDVGSKIFIIGGSSFKVNQYDLNRTINYSFSSPSGVFGESSNIILNLSKGVNQSYSGVVLVYNGVVYSSPTQTDYADYTLFTQEVTNSAIGNFSFFFNVSLNDYGNVFNFLSVNGSHVVYGNNLSVYLFNETNGVNLSGTSVTTLLNDGTTQTSNVSSTGFVLFQNVSSDTYTVTSSASGFDTKSYQVIINSSNNNSLNVYLLQTTANLVVFTVVDDDTGQALPNVEVIIYRWVNNVKTQIADVFSDVTGKVQQEYSDNTRYDYEVILTGYATKTFTLNPIIYTTYTIRLTPEFSTVDDTDFGSLSVEWSPKQFYNNNSYNITFTFNNPSGNLETYGFNASFNGVSCADDGSSLTGSIVVCELNVTNPSYSIYDYVYITYFYKLDYGDLHTYSLKYPVINAGALTWANNIQRDYGLGVFEKTFIGTIIMIILTGAGAMFVGVTGAGLMGLASIYLVVKLGLMTYQLVLVSVFSIVIILAWRMNQ